MPDMQGISYATPVKRLIAPNRLRTTAQCYKIAH